MVVEGQALCSLFFRRENTKLQGPFCPRPTSCISRALESLRQPRGRTKTSLLSLCLGERSQTVAVVAAELSDACRVGTEVWPPSRRRFLLCSGVLVCTDVMARGIDIPEVDWVLQYDPPSSARYHTTEPPLSGSLA